MMGLSMDAFRGGPRIRCRGTPSLCGVYDARLQVLNQALLQADAATATFLQALADDQVKFSGDTVWVLRDGQSFSPVDGSVQMSHILKNVVSAPIAATIKNITVENKAK